MSFLFRSPLGSCIVQTLQASLKFPGDTINFRVDFLFSWLLFHEVLSCVIDTNVVASHNGTTKQEWLGGNRSFSILIWYILDKWEIMTGTGNLVNCQRLEKSWILELKTSNLLIQHISMYIYVYLYSEMCWMISMSKYCVRQL